MTDHRRLKFAYARGARIQSYDGHNRAWINGPVPHYFPGRAYRIHPSDAHLEYGPLSGALRDAVLYDEDSRMCETALDCCEALGLGEDWAAEWGMYQLFLAEALADEGL